MAEKEILWKIGKENKTKWNIENEDEKGESKLTKSDNDKVKSKLKYRLKGGKYPVKITERKCPKEKENS